jgi:hypothetical protein
MNDNKTLENFNVCGVKMLCITKTVNAAEKYNHQLSPLLVQYSHCLIIAVAETELRA